MTEAIEVDEARSPKNRRVLWIALSVVAALIVVAALGGWTYKTRVMDTKERQAAAFGEAEKHWKLALGATTSLVDRGSEFDGIDLLQAPLNGKSYATDTRKAQKALAVEIAATKKALAVLPESQGKTTYLEAIAKLEKASENADEAASALETATAFWGPAAEYVTTRRHLSDDVNDAVDEMNHERWTKALALVADGKRQYARADRALDKLSALTSKRAPAVDKSNITEARADIDLLLKMLVAEETGTKAAKIGAVNRYNAQIDRYNDLNDKMRDLPIAVMVDSPGELAPLASTNLHAIGSLADSARELHDGAVVVLAKTL